jgi:hypothetical protein
MPHLQYLLPKLSDFVAATLRACPERIEGLRNLRKPTKLSLALSSDEQRRLKPRSAGKPAATTACNIKSLNLGTNLYLSGKRFFSVGVKTLGFCIYR